MYHLESPCSRSTVRASGLWKVSSPFYVEYHLRVLTAVKGFTEALSHEVKPEWGIKFTCVEPGGFRTDWAGRSMAFPEKRHPAYDHIDARKAMGDRHGTQAGDPIKGAKAMYELAVMKDPPLRIVIGSDAYKAVMTKIDTYSQNYKKYEQLSNSTDVDGYQRPT